MTTPLSRRQQFFRALLWDLFTLPLFFYIILTFLDILLPGFVSTVINAQLLLIIVGAAFFFLLPYLDNPSVTQWSAQRRWVIGASALATVLLVVSLFHIGWAAFPLGVLLGVAIYFGLSGLFAEDDFSDHLPHERMT